MSIIYKSNNEFRNAEAGVQQEDQKVSFSVVVPCYRAEHHLPACLDSLLNQTLEGLEIICVNDGSPDGTLNILRDYQRRHSDTIVVIDKENEGVWQARLDGIALAHGEYIGFVDSDDYVESTYAEILYSAAVSQDADVVVGGFERTDLDTGTVLSRELCTPRSPFVIEGNEGRVIEINTAPWNKCFRASLLKSMPPLEQPIEVLEDVMFHLLAYLNSYATIAFVPRPLVHYMVHADSAINTIRNDQVSSILAAFVEVRDIYSERRPSMIPALDAIAFLHLGISLVFRMSCNPAYDISSLVSHITAYLDGKFPTWRHSPYISLRYALKNGSSFMKLRIAQLAYRAHSMRAFLACYRFVIDALHVDIKW